MRFETIKRQIKFNLFVFVYQIIQEEKMDVPPKVIEQIKKFSYLNKVYKRGLFFPDKRDVYILMLNQTCHLLNSLLRELD